MRLCIFWTTKHFCSVFKRPNSKRNIDYVSISKHTLNSRMLLLKSEIAVRNGAAATVLATWAMYCYNSLSARTENRFGVAAIASRSCSPVSRRFVADYGYSVVMESSGFSVIAIIQHFAFKMFQYVRVSKNASVGLKISVFFNFLVLPTCEFSVTQHSEMPGDCGNSRTPISLV
jgi:hypothetical protein